MFLPPTLLVTTFLASYAAADFYISNSTTCMGVFIVQNCFHAAQVLSSGSNPNTTYNCNHLVSAEDNNHLNASLGLLGASSSHSEGGICGERNLSFEKTSSGADATDLAYTVRNEQGDHVGDCVPVTGDASFWEVRDNANQTCNLWLGEMYFATFLKCTSSICA